MMSNEKLRDRAKSAGVYLWQIADVIGISDNEFSRRLRHELPEAEKERAFQIIDELQAQKEEKQ